MKFNDLSCTFDEKFWNLTNFWHTPSKFVSGSRPELLSSEKTNNSSSYVVSKGKTVKEHSLTFLYIL